MEHAGFQELVFEDFYEVLRSLVASMAVVDPTDILGERKADWARLLEDFQSPESASLCVLEIIFAGR